MPPPGKKMQHTHQNTKEQNESFNSFSWSKKQLLVTFRKVPLLFTANQMAHRGDGLKHRVVPTAPTAQSRTREVPNLLTIWMKRKAEKLVKIEGLTCSPFGTKRKTHIVCTVWNWSLKIWNFSESMCTTIWQLFKGAYWTILYLALCVCGPPSQDAIAITRRKKNFLGAGIPT